MKISILTPDLSHNCLGRAYLLVKILQRHYKVEIVGPIFGDGVFEFKHYDFFRIGLYQKREGEATKLKFRYLKKSLKKELAFNRDLTLF